MTTIDLAHDTLLLGRGALPFRYISTPEASTPAAIVARVTFQNHALFTERRTCPPGQRYPVVVPWSDWSVAGTSGQWAEITDGVTTHAAYLSYRVGENLRLAFFDAPAHPSGIELGVNRVSSVPGDRVSTYRINTIPFASYIGHTLPDTLTWDDVFPPSSPLTLDDGGSQPITITSEFTAKIYSDDYLAVFYLDLPDRSITVNGITTAICLKGYFYVTARSVTSNATTKFHPRIHYEIQQVWSDPNRPEVMLALADFEHEFYKADNTTELRMTNFGLDTPVPGLELTVGGTRKVSAPYGDALGIVRSSTKMSVRLPDSPGWHADESRILIGDIFCDEIATPLDRLAWDHWERMPGEAMTWAEDIAPYLDPVYPHLPKPPRNYTQTRLINEAFQYHLRRLESPLAQGTNEYWTSTKLFNNTDPSGAGAQEGHGINKLAHVLLINTGNTCWQNVHWYGVHNEFIRNYELRCVGGRPLTWHEFPEGLVITQAQRAATRSDRFYSGLAVPIHYDFMRPKRQFSTADANPIGKSIFPSYVVNEAGARIFWAFPAGGFIGYRKSHSSNNKLMLLYSLTGSFLLKDRLRAFANAALFENPVTNRNNRWPEFTIDGSPAYSYTSDPEQGRTPRVDQALGNVLKCLYGPSTSYSLDGATRAPQASDVDSQTTDENLRTAIVNRLRRKSIPDPGDFNHFGFLKACIKFQKAFGYDAFCPIWYGGIGVNMPLNWKFYDVWIAIYAVPGFYEAYYWLNKYMPAHPATRQCYEMLFWVLQTWSRWVIRYGTMRNYASNPDSPNLGTLQGVWMGVKAYKIPTLLPDKDIDPRLVCADSPALDQYGNGLNIKQNVAAQLEDYLANSWPDRADSSKESYELRYDLVPLGPRENFPGLRIADPNWPEVPSSAVPPPAVDPESIYVKAKSTVRLSGFFEQSGAIGRVALKIAEEVLADTGEDPDMRAAAALMKPHVEAFLAYHHESGYNKLSEAYLCGYNPLFDCDKANAQWLDFTWATDYEPPAAYTELLGPAQLSLTVPEILVTWTDAAVSLPAPVLSLSVPEPTVSGGVPPAFVHTWGAVVVPITPQGTFVEELVTPRLTLSVPPPSIEIPGPYEHTWGAGETFILSVLSGRTVLEELLPAPVLSLSVPAPDVTIGITYLAAPQLTLSVPAPFVETAFEVAISAVLSLAQGGILELLTNEEALTAQLTLAVPRPAVLVDGEEDDFSTAPGLVRATTSAGVPLQNLRLRTEDTATLLYRLGNFGVGAQFKSARWCMKPHQDAAQPLWIEAEAIFGAGDRLAVFLSPELTAVIPWRSAQTRTLWIMELEVRADGDVRTWQSSLVLERDLIRVT